MQYALLLPVAISDTAEYMTCAGAADKIAINEPHIGIISTLCIPYKCAMLCIPSMQL
jgi:hypothetical protein